jgi:hypothetical protein
MKWTLVHRIDLVGTTPVAGVSFSRGGLHSVHRVYPVHLVHYSGTAQLPQHQFRDLQGVKGSPFQELVAAAPER